MTRRQCWCHGFFTHDTRSAFQALALQQRVGARHSFPTDPPLLGRHRKHQNFAGIVVTLPGLFGNLKWADVELFPVWLAKLAKGKPSVEVDTQSPRSSLALVIWDGDHCIEVQVVVCCVAVTVSASRGHRERADAEESGKDHDIHPLQQTQQRHNNFKFQCVPPRSTGFTTLRNLVNPARHCLFLHSFAQGLR